MLNHLENALTEMRAALACGLLPERDAKDLQNALTDVAMIVRDYKRANTVPKAQESADAILARLQHAPGPRPKPLFD